jgi:hypothetical protein
MKDRFQQLHDDIKNGKNASFRDGLANFPDVNITVRFVVMKFFFFAKWRSFFIDLTFLHLCVKYSNFDALVSVLARPDVQVDIQVSKDGGASKRPTPLAMAIWQGALHIAAVLLQSGANPDVADSYGVYFSFIEFH